MSQTRPRLFYMLNRARHVLYKAADVALMERLDVTSAQLGALFVIAESGDCPPGDLAERLDLNASAVTGLAERLERAGFITRRHHEEDRRVTLLALTQAGKDRLKAARPLLDEMNGHMTEGFTAEDMAVVTRFLDNIIHKFSPPRQARSARK